LVGYVPDLIYAPELRYLAEVDEALEPTLRSSSINAQASLIASGAGCGAGGLHLRRGAVLREDHRSSLADLVAPL